MLSLTDASILLFVAALVLAALHDFALRTVPNRLVLILAASSSMLAFLQDRLLVSSAVTTLLLFAVLCLWLARFMGGGDAKLIALIGMAVSPSGVIPALLATALAGGLLCLPYLLGPYLLPRPKPGRPTRILPRLLRCELWRLRRGGPLPYAVAIAAGTLFAMHGA